MPKKKDYLSWDEYFMGIAILASKRSKDPNTQVGSCIANDDNIIVSIGYNGFPRGCSDDEFPWEREAEKMEDTKYPYVVHSEQNAILNSRQNLKGCKIYVTLFPCNECAKAIIQSGIKHIYYLCDKYHDTPTQFVSRRLLDSAGVKYTALDFGKKEITISFDKDLV